jgi:hypothetical protein
MNVISVMLGHAGDVLDSKLYVVGGGNNSAGCGDLLTLDLAGLGGTPLVETPELRLELHQDDSYMSHRHIHITKTHISKFCYEQIKLKINAVRHKG